MRWLPISYDTKTLQGQNEYITFVSLEKLIDERNYHYDPHKYADLYVLFSTIY